MIPQECRRLAEIDFPLSAVNGACMRENNRKTRVDSGHLSLLHSWWARRPVGSSRALLLTLLLPDPTDPCCPKQFKEVARKELEQLRRVGPTDADLQHALFAFVSEFADWDLIGRGKHLSIAQQLVLAAHDTPPHVFDPFSGGGSIPLEGLLLGCEVTASELNPVAWLLLKIALEWSARKGLELAARFEQWSGWVLKEVESRLTSFYPADHQGRKPLAYLWARTVKCEAPNCGALIPLVHDLWLSHAAKRKRALRIQYAAESDAPTIEVYSPDNDAQVAPGTVARFRATCPKCHRTTDTKRVQAQLREKRGGAADAVLLAVVRQDPGGRGKDYYAPRPEDLASLTRAQGKAQSIRLKMPPFPQNDTRAFPPGPYGITNWADLLTPRQELSRWVIYEAIEDALRLAAKQIEDRELLLALRACLYAAYSDNAQYHTSLCVWLSEGVKSVFIQGNGVPMRSDFVEGNPLSSHCDGLAYSIRSVQSALNRLSSIRYAPTAPVLANALDQLLPEESVDTVFTDPPYANQVPYAHLADFFYGWLRLGLKDFLPQAFSLDETEKRRELTENRAVKNGGVHDRGWYERRMYEAFVQMKKAIRADGIASVIFAHKDTDRWEALVSALVAAGWKVTGSWPIATERKQRMRGQGYAALETSVHLVCRPRPGSAPIGDWAEVLRELPRRVGDWMERLQGEGIRGADLVFACIGPALEIFSRYSRVETVEGREVTLAEYLEKVWEVVGRTALEQILGTAEARARNGAAGALEEDARLTALFLWTLQSTNGDWAASGRNTVNNEEEEDSLEEDEEKDTESRQKLKGYALVFDVVRRFAQPLGISLPKWEGRIIETQKGIVRLLPVSERTRQLFGQEGVKAATQRADFEPTDSSQQLALFPELQSLSSVRWPVREQGRGNGTVIASGDAAPTARPEATTLDRVHAAMLLQAGGQTNALRALIKAEEARGPDFLRLANALSALYPRGSEEKRLLDAMLLAVPR